MACVPRYQPLNSCSTSKTAGLLGETSPHRCAGYFALQAASAWSREAPAGSEAPLMTSSQTSLATALTAAVSPLATLLQMPSSFALALAGSVLCALISALQAAIACATFVALGAVVVDVDGVVEVLVVVLAVLAPGVLLWLLVVELLPQPDTSRPQATMPASQEDRRRIIWRFP
jgi:hypothetical protein